jgi:glycosyltransferase involved in cell wall biosynthesis
MKVLIVAPYFYPHPGGVESYTLNIARQLIHAGHEVVVVTSGIAGLPAEQTLEGVKVYRLKNLFRISNTPIGWRWRGKLKRIYALEKPDVINGHMPVPYMADIAERCRGRIPFVLTYHNDLAKTKPLQRCIAALANQVLTKRTLKRCDQIIATSQYYVNSSPLLKRYARKVSLVSPGVDTKVFHTGIKLDALQAKYKDQRVILFVGSINLSQQHKGLDTLIGALAELRGKKGLGNTRLVVVGAGDGVDMYTRQAQDLGVDGYVEFTGYIEDELLAQYFTRADVFAMPSKDRNEGFGMVYMEASAVGTPVVGTHVGGVPYAVIQNETGLLVPPDDVPALVDALKKLLTDTKLASRLGARGAERAAAEFDWQILGARTLQILEQATRPTIIQIAGYYPPSIGGMERVAEALSEKLAERSYDVRVLTSNSNQPAHPKPTGPHLQIQRFRSFEFAHTPFAPGFIPALFRIPKRSVMHLHLAQAEYPEWTLLVSKLRSIPYVVHFHLDLQPTGPLGLLFLLYKKVIISQVIRNANAVIVFSSEQREFIHNTYHVDFERIFVMPNGVGDEYFVTEPRMMKHGPYSLLYVGRINAQKRVHILTQALARMHEPARLTIVGDGEDRAAIEAAVPADLASRITFTGQLSPSDTLPYFKKATVFVMASSIEGMPLAILEAMASGLPVVGADAPGIKELISDVGVLVANPSAATFAAQLDELLRHPAKLEELSRKSSTNAKQYSWSALVDRLEHLYKDMGQ